MTRILSISFGKVRNSVVLDNGTRILHTTNRISAFDRVLPFEVPEKGEILQAISVFFFQTTEDILPNHLIGCLDKEHLLVKECQVIPVELVVRGYLTGSLWRLYEKGGPTLVEATYGVRLPAGLPKNAPLPSPIVTPTSKAAEGHDLPLTPSACLATLDKFLNQHALKRQNATELFDNLTSSVLSLFSRGQTVAAERGLVLVDAKYELGLFGDKLTLVDEVHTPDCARYWLEKDVARGEYRSLSKEFLREEIFRLLGHQVEANFGDEELERLSSPETKKALRTSLSSVYREIYKVLVGNINPAQLTSSQIVPWPLSKQLVDEYEKESSLPRNILVIGNGGRDFSIARTFASKQEVQTVFCAPGARNWGEKCVNLPLSDVKSIADAALNLNVGLVIAGPEQPIAEGISKECRAVGIPVLAPDLEGASLEASKILCKKVVSEADVRTAAFDIFTWNSLEMQLEELLHTDKPLQGNMQEWPLPFVIKYDCLAAGKGVFVVTKKDDIKEALTTIRDNLPAWQKNSSKLKAPTYSGQMGEPCFLIEECLQGVELSVMALCNGRDYRLLPLARDYKRRNDGQKGPNTGGMGTVSPLSVDDSVLCQIKMAFEKTLSSLFAQGHPYYGFLFAGFMLDEQAQLWLLEYNCRLGDPEAQVLLPGLDREFTLELQRTANRKSFFFPEKSGSFFPHDGMARVFVVGAAPEYPEKAAPRRRFLWSPDAVPSSACLIPSAIEPDGTTTGGRAFGFLATSTNFTNARAEAYQALSKVSLCDENNQVVAPHYRKDIGLELGERVP